MMKVPYFIPWIIKKDKIAVINALTKRWLTNGPILAQFERQISKFIGCKYAVGVSNATQALHLSVLMLGLGLGDEVIVPTFTFAATANSVIYSGAKPIFVDVDSTTFNISPKEIRKKITRKTKAVIVVHYGGQACDMNEILTIAKKHNLQIIEDCAHALGSTYGNLKCGQIGHMGCFSFYPTKIITTAEGGMITTNNNRIYKNLKILRSQGVDIQARERENQLKWKYDVVSLGYNYRLDEIRSSLGASQLERIDEINKRRIKIAKKYDEKLEKIKGIIIPQTRSDRNHIYHLYTIRITKDYPLTRNQLFSKLAKANIGTSVQYYPLHLMSYYKKKFGYKNEDFPNSNILKDQVISLPIYPTMKSEQIDYVVSNLKY